MISRKAASPYSLLLLDGMSKLFSNWGIPKQHTVNQSFMIRFWTGTWRFGASHFVRTALDHSHSFCKICLRDCWCGDSHLKNDRLFLESNTFKVLLPITTICNSFGRCAPLKCWSYVPTVAQVFIVDSLPHNPKLARIQGFSTHTVGDSKCPQSEDCGTAKVPVIFPTTPVSNSARKRPASNSTLTMGNRMVRARILPHCAHTHTICPHNTNHLKVLSVRYMYITHILRECGQWVNPYRQLKTLHSMTNVQSTKLGVTPV